MIFERPDAREVGERLADAHFRQVQALGGSFEHVCERPGHTPRNGGLPPTLRKNSPDVEFCEETSATPAELADVDAAFARITEGKRGRGKTAA